MNDTGDPTDRLPGAMQRFAPRNWRLFALAGLFLAGSLGAALSPLLAVRYPLWLLALAPWPRHMLLVAPHTDVIPFVCVASVRAFLSAAIGYEIGLVHGAQGISQWSARSKRAGSVLRTIERLFRRAAIPIMMVAPGPMTGALAAMSGMSRAMAFTPLLLGQVILTYLHYRLGDFLEPYTAPILRFLEEHLVSATLSCAFIVLLYQWVSRKRRLRKLQVHEGSAAPE